MQLQQNSEHIIMGIDPGTNILGYSVICGDKNTIKILSNGILQLKKTDLHYTRLRIIYETTSTIIKKYKPHSLAIESPFFGKNIQSMLKLGRAQGAAILAAANHHIEIIEYSPRKIKQSVTGKGNASKEQVAYMIKSMLQLKELPEHLDETDALAAAICHYNSMKKIKINTSIFSTWKDFIQANPNKILK